MADKLERDHWHPGFLGAMEIEFMEYLPERLSFDDEHNLSKEPIRIDLLIIKKSKDVVIEEQIGQIFRQHNIVEYKSPSDGITIDDFYKTLGYAFLYKGLGRRVNEIPSQELTATMIRDVYPKKLFSDLESEGGTVEQKFPGIYYVSGIVKVPIQIVVTSQLDEALHPSLRLLTKNAQEKDVENFLTMARKFTDPGARQSADALLQVSVSANQTVFENVKRRDPEMCEALRELMKEEIQEERQEAVDISLIAVIKNLMRNNGWDASKAMEEMGISASDQIRYAARLG